jgi:hypothetical protein
MNTIHVMRSMSCLIPTLILYHSTRFHSWFWVSDSCSHLLLTRLYGVLFLWRRLGVHSLKMHQNCQQPSVVQSLTRTLLVIKGHKCYLTYTPHIHKPPGDEFEGQNSKCWQKFDTMFIKNWQNVNNTLTNRWVNLHKTLTQRSETTFRNRWKTFSKFEKSFQNNVLKPLKTF